LAGLYRAYRVDVDNHAIGIIFRDFVLSDKIGFVYSGWDAERAVADFMAELQARAASAVAAGNPDPVIPIILDGENCWEYYRNDGRDFLKGLYAAIEASDDIETVLPTELFGAVDRLPGLPQLFAGSWIDHSFRVWIGHEEDNRAWDLLSLTRDRLVEFLDHHPDLDADKRQLAWKEIHIAEGSDWCWWYGDEHQTSHFHLFDRLFRKHLQNVWRLIDTPPPVELLEPIRRHSKQLEYSEPADWLTPTIDGRETHFFEWFAAGKFDCSQQGGSMHRSDRVLNSLAFGYDRERLYLRIDFERSSDVTSDSYAIEVEFYSGKRYQLVVAGQSVRLVGGDAEPIRVGKEQVEVARDRILELAVPQDVFEFVPERVLYLSVSVVEQGKELEKWPPTGYIGFRLPNPEETLFWEL
jgi:alpha-amylase/alpha-mannosidase (GH57 family)